MAKKAAFGVVKINTGTLVIVADLRDWEAPSESNEIDTTVMGTGKSSMLPGATSDNATLSLFWVFADAAQAYILANIGSETAVAVEVYPEGEGTGLPVWKASCYIMSATPQGAADGAVEMNNVRLVTDSAGAAWSASP